MKNIIALVLLICSFSSFADEHIVIIRHGEKPANGKIRHCALADDDFDSIYHITIKDGIANFSIEHQNLNNMINQCE